MTDKRKLDDPIQSERFKAAVQELESEGNLDPKAGKNALDNVVKRATKQPKTPEES